jgi:hypothetical protein
MGQAFLPIYFYHFELKVDSKELCGVRGTTQWMVENTTPRKR